MSTRFRRLDPEKHEAVRAAFAKLEKQAELGSARQQRHFRTLQNLLATSGTWLGPLTVWQTPFRGCPPLSFHAQLVREVRQIQALLQRWAG